MTQHDHSYKNLFSHAEVVRDLLLGFVPKEWVSELDLDTLEPFKTEFVSETLKERRNDVIWRVRFSDRWLFVYVMLEFQSRQDPYMALRVMVYMGLLYQELIKSGQVAKGELLPPILPIVLYNGDGGWSASTQFADLVAKGPKGFEKFVPNLEYHLLDEQSVDASEAWQTQNLVAAIIGFEQAEEKNLIPLLTELMNWLSQPEQRSIRRSFGVWLYRSFIQPKGEQSGESEVYDLMEVKTMLETKLDKWLEDARQQGVQRGIEAERKKREKMILNMLQQGLPISTIISITGLSKEEIQAFKEE